jgi:acetyl esterase/lipase
MYKKNICGGYIMSKRYIILFLAIVSYQFLLPGPLWSEDINLEEDIVFAIVDQVVLKLDMASPVDGNGPYPALVYIFDSDWGYLPGSRAQCHLGIMRAAEHGYVAATIDYRQTDVRGGRQAKYRFPDQVYDAKCAVRWLRANAKQYRIDPENIGAAGFCCGGHLALMLGLTRLSDDLEGSCGYSEYSSQVQAVVSSAGLTELTSMCNENTYFPDAIAAFIGGSLIGASPRDMPIEYAKASPVSYVYRGCPPILIIHGDRDEYIPINQAFLLDKKMNEAGASHILIIKKNQGHNDFTAESEAFEFFDKYLKQAH